jgi:glycosyltransferase involved in cell wall biosynthesis
MPIVSYSRMVDRDPDHSPPSASPILYVARGGAIDGAGRQLLYLVENLDRSRFRPIVVVDGTGAIVEALRERGTTVEVSSMRPWRSLRGLPFRKADARAASRIGQIHRAAIVHCSDPWRAPYARHIAQTLGVPWMLHVRGPTKPRDLQKYFCLDADHIVGIAERYRAEIAAAGYPTDQITIIDDGVDTQLYRPDPGNRPAARHSLGVTHGMAVGIVGRIEPLKRIEEFIDAAARVPREIDATFLLIGAMHKEDYTQQLREKIERQGLSQRIRFVGRRDDMPAVLAGLDLLVTLSGGSVMFEGMACGTCLLSVRPDGRHSQHTIHNETAWCVTTDEPQPAAEAMTLLLRDGRLRSRLAEAGKACVTERLCPKLMTRKTEAVYESVLVGSNLP